MNLYKFSVDKIQTNKYFEGVWDSVWILIISFITLYYKIGETQLRMATASSDDNPVSIANYLSAPFNYSKDVYLQYVADYGSHSVYNLFPYQLMRFGLSGETIWNFLVALQVVLLYLSITFLLRYLKIKFMFRPQFVLFVALYQPYFWNLGGVGIDLQPYAFTLAIPISVIILVLVLSEKVKSTYIMIFILSLIHPTYAIFIMLLALCYELPGKPFAALLKRFYLVFPTVSLILYQGFVFRERSLQVPDVWRDFIWANGHLNFYNPWKSFSGNLTAIYWFYVLFLSLTCYLILKKSNIDKLRKMLLSLMAVSTFGVLLNFVAMTFEINLIANLLGARITSLLTLFSLAVIYQTYTNKKIVDKMEGLYFRLFYVFPHPVFLAQLVASKLFKKKYVSLLIFLPSIILGYGLIVRFERAKTLPFSDSFEIVQKFVDISTLNIGSALVSTILLNKFVRMLFVLLMVTLALSLINPRFFDVKLFFRRRATLSLSNLSKSRVFYTTLTSVLMTVSAAFGFSYAYQFSFNSNTWSLNQVKDLRDAQLWAKSNTPPNAAFIVNPNKPFLPWRTLSDRTAIPLGKVIGAYGYYDYMDQFNVKLTNYFNKFPDAQSLSASRLCEFINEFGGDYLVDSVNSGDFLKVVDVEYRNSTYYLGKITCPDAR
jgi:hypothetical protein